MNKLKFIVSDNMKRVSETVYIIVLCLYIYSSFNAFTQVQLPFTDFISAIIIWALIAVYFLQVCVHFEKKDDIFNGLLVIIFFYLISHFSGREELVYLSLIMASSIGVNFNKVVKCGLTVDAFLFFCITVYGLVDGRNIFTDTSGGDIISSIGDFNPNGSGMLLLFICVLYYVQSSLPGYYALILVICSAFVTHFYFGAGSSFVCLILLGCFILYEIVARYVKSGSRFVLMVFAFIRCVAIAIIPISSVMVLVITYGYSNGEPWAIVLNRILFHNRISRLSNAIQEYGIGPFGSDFIGIGAIGPGISVTKNYVDISIGYLLLTYGYIVVIIIALIWTMIVYRAIVANNYRLIAASIVIVVHGIEEASFFYIMTNLLIMVPFAVISGPGITAADNEYGADSRQNIIKHWSRLLQLALLMIMLLLFPTTLARFRTFADIESLSDNNTVITSVLSVSVIFYAASVCVIFLAGKVNNMHKKTYLICFGGLLSLIVGIWLYAGIYNHSYYDEAQKRFTEDKKAIDIAMSSCSTNVYSNVFPELYKQEFSGLSRSLFVDANMVRKQGSTIVTDYNYNNAIFFNKGWLYTRISDYSAIYTSDKAVINAMEDAGYHFCGYFNTPIIVPLVKTKYSSDSTPMQKGDYVFKGTILFDGETYPQGDVCVIAVTSETASYSIHLKSSDFSNENIATFELAFSNSSEDVTYSVEIVDNSNLRVTDCRYGFSDLGEEKMTPVLLDSISYDTEDDILLYQGNYDIELNIKNPSFESTKKPYRFRMNRAVGSGDDIDETELTVNSYSDNYSYQLKSKGANYKASLSTSAELSEVSLKYSRIMDYDIHNTYDNEGRVSRCEYFDLDGNKITRDGVFAIEYEYDRKGNKIVERYYDENDSPHTISSGYAEVHREYDRLNYIISESYYGIDGEMVMNSSGYAALTRVNDEWGKKLSEKYYDVNYDPVVMTAGYAEIRFEYADDQVVRETYYGIDGNRIFLSSGYSGIKYKYDDAGNNDVITYIDDDDSPVMTSSGYAEIHREFDDKGRVVVEYYFDESGDRIVPDGGYATIVYQYDDAGNMIAVRKFYYEDTSLGGQEILYEYDDKNRVVFSEIYDENGAALFSGGYHAIRYEYDESGDIAATTYYDLDMNEISID